MKRAGLALIFFALMAFGALAQGANPVISGNIAFIGSDFNVYTLRGETRTMLTDDASVGSERVNYYQFPTWAVDGRLAYFRTELTGRSALTMEIFVSDNGESPGESVYVGEGESFTYAYWSPSACGTNCFDLAVLLGSASVDGFLVNLIRDSSAAPTVTQAGTGSPFYYSWSPDGQRMIWQRNNRQIDIFDVNANAISQTLDEAPGGFFAPAWSPVDDRLLFGAANGRDTDLSVSANGVVETLVERLPSPIRFAWSPDGNYIAYKDALNPLIVIDAVNGDVIAESHTSDVFAFFWSPNSRTIAYISPGEDTGSFNAKPSSQANDRPELTWSVLEVDTGSVRGYGTFFPTNDQLYLFTYFDQFGQSHRVWSPDSRHLLYAEIDLNGDPQIMLLDTQSNVVPLSIAQGFFAVWSFD